MRIDMIYFPTDLFADQPADVDVEASGQTFVAQLREALAEEFPEARLNVLYSPTAIHSEEEFEIHFDAGEIEADARPAREREIRDRVAEIAGDLRAGDDWIVRNNGVV